MSCNTSICICTCNKEKLKFVVALPLLPDGPLQRLPPHVGEYVREEDVHLRLFRHGLGEARRKDKVAPASAAAAAAAAAAGAFVDGPVNDGKAAVDVVLAVVR